MHILTDNNLLYALVGITFRAYSWTVLSVVTYFIFRIFNTDFKKNKYKIKIHKLFLLVIPLLLANVITLSVNLETTTPLIPVDVVAFIAGVLMLISFLGIYFYLKGEGEV